jgi:hypothetical protein
MNNQSKTDAQSKYSIGDELLYGRQQTPVKVKGNE